MLSVRCFSVAKLYLTLCNPMDCSVSQASLSLTFSQGLPNFMSNESVISSNHHILCCPLFVLLSIFTSIRVFSNESHTFLMNWPLCHFMITTFISCFHFCLNYLLYDIRMATLTLLFHWNGIYFPFFEIMSAVNSEVNPLCLNLKWVYCRQHRLESFFFVVLIHLATLCPWMVNIYI